MSVKGSGHSQFSRRDFLKLAGLGAAELALLAGKNAVNKAGGILKFADSLSAVPESITPGHVLEWIRPVPVRAGLGAIAGAAWDAFTHIKSGKDNIEISDLKGTAIGVGVDTLTGCSPKPEGTPPTAEQIEIVTAQATALPTELNPITATSTPPALESVPAPTEDVTPEFPSTIDGLYIGEVTPGNIVGMIPGYESTGINTIYNPNDATQIFDTANGTIEAIPPRAFGIDQNQLINYFHAQETEGGIIMGDHQGMSLTLQNGIWKASTGETFIPFIKAEPNTDAVYLVMDANGEIQKVDITGKAIGAPSPMFETPQAIAARMGFEKADQVVDVEMNKNGSLSFITKEPRSTENAPNSVIQIVNEIPFIGEPEDLSMNQTIQNSAEQIAQEMTQKGTATTKDALLQNGLVIKRITNITKEGKQDKYDVVTIKSNGKSVEYPLSILNRETGVHERVDMNKLFDMAGMDYAITAAWDEENKAAWDEWLKEGDILVPDSASTQRSMDTYGLESLESYFRRTRSNNQGYRMNSVFWDEGDVSDKIKGETDPVKIEKFMRDRISQLMSLRPTQMNMVLEPFDLINGEFVWAKTPWFNAYGENWPVKAFQFAQEEAAKLNITLGKDIKLYWNDFRLDRLGPKLDLTLEIISNIIQSGYHIDGVGLQIYNGKQNKYNPHVPTKEEIVEVLGKIGEKGLSTYVEYGVFRNPESTPELVPIGVEIFKSCQEINKSFPGKVESFNIWDDYDPDSPLDPDSFAFYNKETYAPNMNYFALQAGMVESMAQV